jgi:hypothetical protein
MRSVQGAICAYFAETKQTKQRDSGDAAEPPTPRALVEIAVAVYHSRFSSDGCKFKIAWLEDDPTSVRARSCRWLQGNARESFAAYAASEAQSFIQTSTGNMMVPSYHKKFIRQFATRCA